MLSRHTEAAIRTALGDTRVVAIAGPRQSGKTTLARAIASQTHRYVTLDDPALLNAARADPAGLIRRLDRAVIAEIQRAPEPARSITPPSYNSRPPSKAAVIFLPPTAGKVKGSRGSAAEIFDFSNAP
jgi:hypothetical protein